MVASVTYLTTRIRGEVDCERAAFALFAIPFASVMMSRMLPGQLPAEDLDIMGGTSKGR